MKLVLPSDITYAPTMCLTLWTNSSEHELLPLCRSQTVREHEGGVGSLVIGRVHGETANPDSV